MVIKEKQLSEPESFFTKTKLLKSILLDTGTPISNVPKFVENHFAVLWNNMDKPIYEVFFQRLLGSKEKISG